MNKKNMVDREYQIMSLILQRVPRREIAYKFDICESRISQIVSKNWSKLSIKDKRKFKNNTLKYMAEKSKCFRGNKNKAAREKWWTARYGHLTEPLGTNHGI